MLVLLAGTPAGAAPVHSACELRDGARLCLRAEAEGGSGPIVELWIKKIKGVDHARAVGWVPQAGHL
ncbi:hypothetical protein ACIRBY_37290 [Streptomyces sp. NPDC096136]|uniref:hypothetical protein n=1 Tax=Streptomyces sp. NPDC096136 TaxID=3366076 RepID=UPI0038062B8C